MQVGDEGIKVLAEALTRDTTLLSLFLRNNAIGPEVLIIILRGVRPSLIRALPKFN